MKTFALLGHLTINSVKVQILRKPAKGFWFWPYPWEAKPPSGVGLENLSVEGIPRWMSKGADYGELETLLVNPFLRQGS